MEELKYCRHFNRKTKEGGKHPDRDAQFEYINSKAEAFQAADQPVISIDSKKKELLGEFKNGGSDYGPQGQPIEVNTHDFEDKELGKFVPYGIDDIGANLGYVSLGIDHDTGQFAVNGVRLWLDRMGRERYPSMMRLMITADGGGSNGSRLRLWKVALQQLADLISLAAKHGNDRIVKAVQRAATLGLYSYTGVRNMLDNHMENAPLPSILGARSADEARHSRQIDLLAAENIRGKDHYH